MYLQEGQMKLQSISSLLAVSNLVPNLYLLEATLTQGYGLWLVAGITTIKLVSASVTRPFLFYAKGMATPD